MNPFKDEIHLLAKALKTVTCCGLVHRITSRHFTYPLRVVVAHMAF